MRNWLIILGFYHKTPTRSWLGLDSTLDLENFMDSSYGCFLVDYTQREEERKIFGRCFMWKWRMWWSVEYIYIARWSKVGLNIYGLGPRGGQWGGTKEGDKECVLWAH